MNVFLNFGESILINLALLIDSIIYNLISSLYGLYLQLANARIFSSDTVTLFADRIYLVIGVIALFLVSYSILQLIINPDSKSNSGVKIVQRIIIALVLVPLIPAAFNFMYGFQGAILSDNVIPTLLLGYNDANVFDASDYFIMGYDGDVSVEFSLEDSEPCDSDEGCSKGYFMCSFDEESTGKVEDYMVTSVPLDITDDFKHISSRDIEKAIEECDGKGLLSNTEKLDANIALQKMYGNELATTVLTSLMIPTEGLNPENIESADLEDFSISTAVKLGAVGCAIGLGAVAFLAISTATITGGLSLTGLASFAAAFKGSGAMAVGYCLTAAAAGAATGGAIGYGVGSLILKYGESITWSEALFEMNQNGNFSIILSFADNIQNGELNYMLFITSIAGAFILYVLFSFCLDLGLRAVKLAFYQLIAPIPIFLSILPNNSDLIKNWFKLVVTTFTEVFIRIGVLSGIIYFLSFLNLNELDLGATSGVATVIIIMGIIMFAKQFPKLFSEATGIKSGDMKLGIMPKLADGGALAAGSLANTVARRSATSISKSIADYKKIPKGERTKKGLMSAVVAGTARAGVASLTGAGSGIKNIKKSGALGAKNLGDMISSSSKAMDLYDEKSLEKQRRKEKYIAKGYKAPLQGRAMDAWNKVKVWANYDASVKELDDLINLANTKIESVENIKKGPEKVLTDVAAASNEKYWGDVELKSTYIDRVDGTVRKDTAMVSLSVLEKNLEAMMNMAYNPANEKELIKLAENTFASVHHDPNFRIKSEADKTRFLDQMSLKVNEMKKAGNDKIINIAAMTDGLEYLEHQYGLKLSSKANESMLKEQQTGIRSTLTEWGANPKEFETAINSLIDNNIPLSAGDVKKYTLENFNKMFADYQNTRSIAEIMNDSNISNSEKDIEINAKEAYVKAFTDMMRDVQTGHRGVKAAREKERAEIIKNASENK